MRFIVNAAYDNLPDAGLLPFIDRHPPTITPDTELLTICQTFLDQATRRLPVLENGKLIGQVSRRDVMRKVNELASKKSSSNDSFLYLSALLNEGEGRDNVAWRMSH